MILLAWLRSGLGYARQLETGGEGIICKTNTTVMASASSFHAIFNRLTKILNMVRNMLNMQMQGKRRGRPKKRWLDNIREDMNEYKMTVRVDMAQN